MNIKRKIKHSLLKQALKRKSLRHMIARKMLKRAIKPIPLIGAGVVAALAIGTIRRKGALKGSADVALDLIPGVGLTKSVVEIFTGDLIPDKKAKSV
ncbi:MAG TPA: hypothetical protein VF131_26135 [Blastocatellia bacterium]|nr:hypothetical protein [Blastocatellia bacterium]